MEKPRSRKEKTKHEALRVQEVAQEYKEKTRTRIIEAREKRLFRVNETN